MLTSRRKAHLIIITTFVLGVIAGASGQYLLSYHASTRRAPTVAEVADELARVLKLSSSQRSQVEQILGECQQQHQDLKAQNRPHFQGIRDKARNRVRALLSTEQQTVYDDWIRDLDTKREKKTSEEGK